MFSVVQRGEIVFDIGNDVETGVGHTACLMKLKIGKMVNIEFE